MKFSDLPKLIFTARQNVCFELSESDQFTPKNCFQAFQSPKGKAGYCFGLTCIDSAHPAFAFFASQISLEDYHGQSAEKPGLARSIGKLKEEFGEP